MKKFSKVAGVQTSEKPDGLSKIQTGQSQIQIQPEDEILFIKILDLIDDCLRIRSIGAARKNILPQVEIEGKENLARKIIELLQIEQTQETLDVLSSLKDPDPSVKNKIQNLNEKLDTIEKINKLEPQIKKILEAVKIIDKNLPLVKYKLTNLSVEEIDKRISAIDTMLKSKNWQNIRTQLQTLRLNYQDRLDNL